MARYGVGLGIRLMEHALITLTGGSGLVGVDPGNQNEFIGNLLIQSAESGDVFQNWFFMICRAGTDDQQEFIGFTFKDFADLSVPLSLYSYHSFAERELLFDFLGDGKLSLEIHIHKLHLFYKN